MQTCGTRPPCMPAIRRCHGRRYPSAPLKPQRASRNDSRPRSDRLHASTRSTDHFRPESSNPPAVIHRSKPQASAHAAIGKEQGRGSQAGIREVDRAIRAAERRTAQPPHGNKKGMSASADIPFLQSEDRLAAISVRTKPASHRGCCRRHRPRNAPDPKPASRRRAYISGPPA